MYVYFPDIVAEYYGVKHSLSNYAVLYTAKVGGGIFAGTVTGGLVTSVGWIPTFALGSGLALAAGIGAFVLRPLIDAGIETGTSPL